MNNDRERFKEIKKHFNSEADKFDSIITDRVPFYALFVRALVNVLPFEKDKKIKVADLGCGTGTIAHQVKETFPNAVIDCVDFSPEMLASARKKLAQYTDIAYHESDVLQFDLAGYDAVLSSLCLHHIGVEEDKKNFFKKVYQGLRQGGVFYIYDVILASNSVLQNVYLEEWKRFMSTNLSAEEVQETIRKYHQEDRPFPLMKELDRLKEAGFSDVDVIYKFYNGAVYGGIKKDL